MNKKDALLPKKLCGINVVSKSKKDSLPHTSVTPPLIVRFKLARNTKDAAGRIQNAGKGRNKKTKATNLIINKKKDKSFETVFARMEKRRMLSKNKTIDSPVDEDEVCQVKDDDVASGVDEVKIGDDNDNDMKDNKVYDDDNKDRNSDKDSLRYDDNEDRNNDKDEDENEVKNEVADEDDEDDGDYEDDDDVKENNYNDNNDVKENEVANNADDVDNVVKENVVDGGKMNTTMAMIPCWHL